MSSAEPSKNGFENQIQQKPTRKEIGFLGEQAAERYLHELGWTFIARNWTCRIGEIDLLFLDGDTLVLVEVKSRLFESKGAKFLFDTITPRKRRKLCQLMQIFLKRNSRFQRYAKLRIDVLGVLLCEHTRSTKKLKHIRAAVSASF